MIRSRAVSRILPAGMLLAACLGSMPNAANAATKAGVTVPDTMQVEGATLVLNGIGVRSFTILHIRGYVGALYLLKKSTDVDTVLDEPNPKVLVIHYVHSGTQAQLNRLYMDSSRTYCAKHACTEANKIAFEQMLATIRPVKPGDYSSFVLTDHGVEVYLDGQKIAVVPDASFGRVILDSDLGTTAPSAELRDGLLGLPAD
ncbi:chalcone isomerase family protein [Acetobacteraceae bacterium KSS8]|uniref:Chalcone isomerase family protein n=1 Tax=Endosaccharibacter trunci TaxID=2812733 RepID=A0ABT1W671_9PROT|nr:chalcone isomerase family protein [Acetobacteraceae bacterium KSS8]